MDVAAQVLQLLSLESKVAVISGGASGIGLGTAKRLAEFGAKVALLDIQDENGARAVQNIEEEGGTALFIHCDVRNIDECKSAVQKTIGAFGRIDILFNNPSIVIKIPIITAIVITLFKIICAVLYL